MPSNVYSQLIPNKLTITKQDKVKIREQMLTYLLVLEKRFWQINTVSNKDWDKPVRLRHIPVMDEHMERGRCTWRCNAKYGGTHDKITAFFVTARKVPSKPSKVPFRKLY